MATYLDAAARLLFKSKPKQGRLDEEHAQRLGSVVGPPADIDQSAIMSSTAGGYSSNQLLSNQQSQLPPRDEPLTQFRLMLGITNHPHLGFTEDNGSRPASNLGIYARVAYNERRANDSYKIFSLVINGCYFLQIVVAAALTALGAANANNRAITAFGAINTVIAGFLTFLKGSGLPARLKYYGNEWKSVREFIEQRERDFLRDGCTLDVFEVVEGIEKMYNSVKQDIEMNTPDNYTSMTNPRRAAENQALQNQGTSGGSVDVSKLEGLASKLKGLDGSLGEKVRSLTDGLERKRAGVVDGIHAHEKQIGEEIEGFKKAVVREVEEHRADLEHETRERQHQAGRMYDEAAQQVRDTREGTTRTVSGGVQRIGDTHERAVEDTRRDFQTRVESTADTLVGRSTRPGSEQPGESGREGERR